ncbi:hypothetical protein M433DRAFT_241694 [Acidomyces richmondensis BFW]|nr:MAG: hypothetical protein FE78DRAFT_417243 [Acidomyces sp. 'richmondensis']KYG49814.1 hypothetical protein M433DRAFT_241694 [Acidomyces richmondensis BFW]
MHRTWVMRVCTLRVATTLLCVLIGVPLVLGACCRFFILFFLGWKYMRGDDSLYCGCLIECCESVNKKEQYRVESANEKNLPGNGDQCEGGKYVYLFLAHPPFLEGLGGRWLFYFFYFIFALLILGTLSLLTN